MSDREARARIGAELAFQHGGVVHRRDLRAAGIDHDAVRREVEIGRWAAAGRHTVVIGGDVPTGEGLWWRAVWESGAGAALDGVAALWASGLTGFDVAALDVAIPKNNRRHKVDGVRLRQRRSLGRVFHAGVPRARSEWACIRAAQWAVSDRQAALVLCMTVQQRLVSPARLLATWQRVTWSRRRSLLNLIVPDICNGAHSLGELDFVRLCRRYGIPPPTQQVVREGRDGRVYLDNYWDDADLAVEIDGTHHGLALNPVDDALRQNELTLSNDRVLRIPSSDSAL